MADWRDLILSNKLDILKPFWHFYFTKIVKLQTCLLSKSFAHFTVCGSTSRKIYNDLSSLLQGYTKGIFSFIFFSSSSEVSLWFTFVCLFVLSTFIVDLYLKKVFWWFWGVVKCSGVVRVVSILIPVLISMMQNFERFLRNFDNLFNPEKGQTIKDLGVSKNSLQKTPTY